MPYRARETRRPLRLRVERLDPRLPLAGDVTATLAAGVLTLQGDVEANGVEVSVTQAGDLLVAGRRVDGVDTSLVVDGEAVAERAFRDVTVLRVRLGAGADSFRLFGRETFDLDAVDIGTGPGADRCMLDLHATLAGSATISTGADDDFVSLSATVLGDLRLLTGDGADQVSGEWIFVGGRTIIDTGTATLTMSGAGPNGRPLVGRDLVVRALGGGMTVGIVGVSVGRDLRVSTGAGEDQVTVSQLATGRRLQVATGPGNGTVRVDGVAVGEDARLVGGANADSVRMRSSSVQRRLFANLGAGGDALDVNGVAVGRTDLRGGAGTDALVTDLLLNLVAPTFRGFESVERG